jgi:RecA-family ATPase
MTNENKEQLYNQLQSRSYKIGHIPSEHIKILTVRNRLVATLQNYCIISGMPKAGKSTYMAGLTASSFTIDCIFQMKLQHPPNRKKVCYIDTESSEWDFYRQINRITKLCYRNEKPNELDAFAVREDNHKMIIAYIELYLQKNPDCYCVIIDGLLDLIMNFNDEVESRMLVQWLKKVTKEYNILIIAVLHLGKKDGQTLGHLGSNTDRYAVSTLEVIKDKEQQTFILQSKFMRSDADFEPVAIRFGEGQYYEVDYNPTPQQNFKQKKGS